MNSFDTFMDMPDNSGDFCFAPDFGQSTGKEPQVDLQRRTPLNSRASADTIQILLEIVRHQVKAAQQLDEVQKQLDQISKKADHIEKKMNEQDERLEKLEMYLLERSQAIIERQNDCIGLLESPSLRASNTSLAIMDIRDKQLPPIPEEYKTCSYKEVASSCMQHGNPCSTERVRKENEDLKKANETLLRQVQKLAFENSILQDEQAKTEKKLKHHLKIIEIQRESLKSLRQWAIVSTADCRTKCTELEQTTTEDSVRSIDATMF
ncbi:hypothetical protein FCIRC_12692 [Fusarium circinatum]|uniref:Uncharacterized protein n=1 Tax=Fusarium circinatum TaxID=48490 RepID=A0A8H5WI08_FUSCI|nr:hypothetical protein FCIRC_12692 [Fusarium circinatum]